jgi:hypothetical protein
MGNAQVTSSQEREQQLDAYLQTLNQEQTIQCAKESTFEHQYVESSNFMCPLHSDCHLFCQKHDNCAKCCYKEELKSMFEMIKVYSDVFNVEVLNMPELIEMYHKSHGNMEKIINNIGSSVTQKLTDVGFDMTKNVPFEQLSEEEQKKNTELAKQIFGLEDDFDD